MASSPTRGTSGPAAEVGRATPDHEEHPLKADAFAQRKLLELQEVDSRVDLLRHRLTHLPQTAELTALTTERDQVDGARRDAQIQADDLSREQRKADADVEQVKTRRVRDQDRMDRGLVTNAKDLERMSRELVSLARRIAELEDLELEIMARLEDAQLDADRHARRVAEIDEQAGVLVAARDAAAGEVRAQLDTATGERSGILPDLPEALLALYEKVRTQKGGVGAAGLVRHRCTGCSLELTAADLGDIARAPLDEVQRCVECNRILVRTAESGI